MNGLVRASGSPITLNLPILTSTFFHSRHIGNRGRPLEVLWEDRKMPERIQRKRVKGWKDGRQVCVK